MATLLRPFQEEGVRGIYRFRGRALLADEQGLGKTIQALTWIRRLPRRRPVVIVTPSSVKFTWQAEAMAHFNMRLEVLEGHLKQKDKRRGLPSDIVVLNYDILHSWLPVLLKANPQVVVFDEIHFCRNLTARRTKAAIRLAENVPSVVGLSGTPLLNLPIELWSVLRIVKPEMFPSRERFAWRYCRPRYTPWGWRYDGATNLPELNQILRRECMIRRLKKDVLKELPDKDKRVDFYRLPRSQEEEYNYAKEEFISWLQSISPARANRAKRNQALTKVGYLLRLVAELKLSWTEKWIREFFERFSEEKLVAFTMHQAVIDRLQERFSDICVVVNGQVTGRHRAATVRRFQQSPTVKLFLGNLKAGGAGLTLTAARQIVFLDLPWTPGDLMQGEDRVHRIGQEGNVIVHYLIALATIEEVLIKLLRRKGKILKAVLNGQAGEEELDILGQLLAAMSKTEDPRR